MKKIRRLPTILGLLILLIGIGVGVVLVHKGPVFFLRAKPEITPKQVKISNISDISFTVSWITDTQTSGFAKYGTETGLTMVAQDDRDQLSGKTGSFITHHTTLKNLKPSTEYQFRLGSGERLFDNNGQPYKVTTAPRLQTSPPLNDVAYGTVITQDESPAPGVIIYLSLANTVLLSTLTKSSGNWVTPLNLARSTDLSSYTTYDREASVEEILVQGGQQGTATAVTTTKNDSPVPPITLGQSYDFRRTVTTAFPETQETPTIPATPTPPSSKFGFQELPSPPPAKLTIINPTEGEEVNTQKPAILGTGPAGKTIKIILESPELYSDDISVGALGNWEWAPPTDLSPGEHTVTVNYLGGDGQEQTASRRFTVLAAGNNELLAFTATPSGATATPSPTVTPSPTASPTPTPTATPSARVSMPSTEEGVPTPGILTPTFFVFIIGTVLIISGLSIDLVKIRKRN